MQIDRRKFLTGVGTAGGIALAGCTGGPTGGDGGDGGDGGSESTPTATAEPTEADDSDSNSEEETETETESEMETESPTSSDPVNVGMVYATGGLGDGSFNDQAQQGIQQAESEFGI